MVREDDTAGGQARQKSMAVRPTTLDLNAVEIRTESSAAAPESAGAPAEGDPQAEGEPGQPGPWSGETPQEPAAPAAGETPDTDAATAAAVGPEGEAEPRLDTSDAPRAAVDAGTPEEPATAPADAAAETAGDHAAPPVQPAPKLDIFETPPPQRRLPLLLAALAGGVAGAVLVLAAVSSGLVPLGRSNDDLSPRLAAAEQDIASNKSAADQAMSRAAAAEDAAKAARDAANDALNLAGEAQKSAAATPAGTAPAAASGDAGPLADRLAKAEADIASLHAALDEAAKAQEAAIAPVGDKAAAAAAAASEVQAGLRDTQKQVAALAASTSAASNKAAAYAVALAEVAQAVRDGRPFEPELKTAAAIGGNADALAPLAALAATGVPSTETLAASFDAVRPAIVAALTPKPPSPPADAGVMDRLMSSLGHVVVITREGDGSPDDPAAPVQKVSDALHRGDLAGAVAVFKAMPEAGQQAGAAWLAQAGSALGALDVIQAETAAALQKFSSP
ncbi:COG4223 family protein [Labrys monachus]|uniref:Uncharacterized protein n=1 Tax=Labrys monachus TaxID=217067 RepID=A0ABU0FMZ7_9HYPH|nr:hypothetical protein [Labrys monachus]MDQ0395975.1 hypothetical protein [Labrys monachus]